MDFSKLIDQLREAHTAMQVRAGSAVNQSHTLRNWLFGYYIVEFEQHGQDYAEYGARLLYRIAAELKKSGLKGISYTNLTLFRKFYLFYPQIGSLVRSFLDFDTGEKSTIQILQAPPEEFENTPMLPVETLLSKFTFTHFVELIKVEDPVNRFFYEIECIKGNWTYRQLQRQIGRIILCTGKNASVVKYATGSLDNQILVSKYMLQLPDERTLLRFLDKEKQALSAGLKDNQ